jgi:hypothetical protein
MQVSPGTSADAVRPDPGLARGVWEAPPLFFVAALALVALVAMAWVLRALATLAGGRQKKAGAR